MIRINVLVLALATPLMCGDPPGLSAMGFTIQTGVLPPLQPPKGTISMGSGSTAYTLQGTAGSITDNDGDMMVYTWAETAPTFGIASGTISWDPAECKYKWSRTTPSSQGPYCFTQP